MDDASERWLPVVGWERLYEVSDLARVRSVDRFVHYKDGRTPLLRGKILTQFPNTRGYLCVILSRDASSAQYPVHRLVGETFLGPLPDGMETRHGPGGKLDNRPVNLSYGTPLENQRDRVRDGTGSAGSMNGRAKLTEDLVRECRARRASGASCASLAREFGVNKTAIHKAVTGQTWKHVAA